MWEVIRANRRKSLVLFVGMGVCLLVLGYVVGSVWLGPDGGTAGIVIAGLIWFVMSLVSYFSGDSILLAVSKAHPVTRDVHPQLFNVVEEMKISAGLPVMPKVYIIDDPAPNAFATGRKVENCSVAVTAGLLGRLNRDELQGVIAHEVAHISNRDVMLMSLAGVMLGGIVIISQIFLRSMLFSSGSSRRYSSGSKGGGGQAQLVMVVVAVALAILAPILARLLYFAISRKREYLADASAARLTRYPEGLASALEKISDSSLDLASANKATAPMYIVNPLKAKGKKVANLTSTHPPISERVKILRSMMSGAGYSEYQEAYFRIKGKGSMIIPGSGLRDGDSVDIRKPSVKEKQKSSRKKGMRDVGDIMRAVNKYAFLMCVCGLKMKIPPDFNKKQISCPRCSREMEIPTAELAAVAAATEGMAPGSGAPKAAQTAAGPQQVYTRKGKGWESFSCNCGRLVQLSPGFLGPNILCKDCGRIIDIKS